MSTTQHFEPIRSDPAGRIRGRLVETLRDDLAELARAGTFPGGWLTVREIARCVEQARYWLDHPEPLAAFLSSEQSVGIVSAALADLTANDARSWWRKESRYRAHAVDWTQRARETADRLRQSHPQETRTAIYRGPEEESVIFANENSADGEIRRQIALLRDALRAAGIHEIGFNDSTDQQAWVMLVYPSSDQQLQSVLFELWQRMTY